MDSLSLIALKNISKKEMEAEEKLQLKKEKEVEEKLHKKSKKSKK